MLRKHPRINCGKDAKKQIENLVSRINLHWVKDDRKYIRLLSTFHSIIRVNPYERNWYRYYLIAGDYMNMYSEYHIFLKQAMDMYTLKVNKLIAIITAFLILNCKVSPRAP